MVEPFIAAGRYSMGSAPPVSIAYAAGAEQEPILLPAAAKAGCTVSFDVAGSARVEGTNFGHDMVAAGTAAWKAWDAGDVSATTQQVAECLTAVRLVRISGTPRLTVNLVGA